MSRYIDADALLNKLPDDLPYKASVKRLLLQAPTADVVEVVRCEDCAKRMTGDCPMAYCYEGTMYEESEDEYFCSYGERRAQ